MNDKWSQASCSQAGWEFSAWMDSRTVHSILPMVQSHIPVFIHFVPFCPSSSVISQVPLPMSNYGLPPTKTSNEGKVYGPQKSSQRTEKQKKSGKINVVWVLSSGKGLWDGGGKEEWIGGMLSSSGSTARGMVVPFAKEPGSGTDKLGLGLVCTDRVLQAPLSLTAVK